MNKLNIKVWQKGFEGVFFIKLMLFFYGISTVLFIIFIIDIKNSFNPAGMCLLIISLIFFFITILIQKFSKELFIISCSKNSNTLEIKRGKGRINVIKMDKFKSIFIEREIYLNKPNDEVGIKYSYSPYIIKFEDRTNNADCHYFDLEFHKRKEALKVINFIKKNVKTLIYVEKIQTIVKKNA